MGQYVVLIYEDEKGWSDGDPAVIEEGMKAHNQFAVDAGEKLRGGQALQPTATATTIHKDGSGGFAVTDGPFVETKEALGGFYIIEAADLDEAIALAKKVPAPFGGVEVRPVMVFE
ncbi:MAG TPA: YciI family protein [Mycobacteriales bacterium]